MEEEKKKNIRKIAIFVIVIIVLLAGATYAFFRNRRQSEQINVTSAKKISLDFETSDKIILDNAVPIKESEISTKAFKSSFTMTNTGKSKLYVDISMSSLNVSNNFKDYDVKWALYDGNTKLTTGTFAQTLDGSTSINMVNNIELEINATKSYNLYIWINETPLDQNSLQGGSLSGKITVVGRKEKSNTLAYKILGNNNSNVQTNTLEFDKETTDLGLYVQKEDSEKSEFGFPVYYYRGEVTNNYVNFAGQNWRIMGINEDGTIKLAGLTTVDSTLDMTKDYATDPLSFDDYIGTNLNNWYNSNITGTNDSLVATENFCYDKTNTFDDLNPTLNCRDTNGTVITKIGTFSTDELMYAGAFIEGFAGNNNNFYLAGDFENTTQTTLTFGLNSNNKIYPYKLTTAASTRSDNIIPMEFSGQNTETINVRPVINLKSNVTITGGTGTKADPYVIG